MGSTSSKGSSVDVSKNCEASLSVNGVTVRSLTQEDLLVAAKICQEAFNTFNASVALPPEFPPLEVVNVPEMLLGQALGEGFEGFVAVDDTGAILGSNLVELRDEVAGIGPISVSTDAANKGVGRLLMQAVMQAAKQNSKERVRLHQIGPNVKSFSLYLDCGFDPLVTCCHYEGVCTASAPLGFTFDTLAEKYVDGCDKLHKQVYGCSRRNDIRAMIPHPAPGGVVLDLRGKVVAYTVGCFLSGHTVAATFESFQALTVEMSKKIEDSRAEGAPLPPCTFFVPQTHPDVLRWLSRNGFKYVRAVVQMGYGPHEAPKGLYMPAIQY